VDELVELNPSLLRRITPKNQPFDLHLPPGTKDKFETAIASIPEAKRVAWRYHKVQNGETLVGIARKYHTTERAIAQVNNLADGQLLADTKLVIPVSAAASTRVAYSRHPSRYRVHSGDTVLSVAEDFGVPPERLRRWNRLKGNSLRRGRVLVVYKPLTPGEVDRAPRRAKKSGQHSRKHVIKKAAAQKSTETVAEGTR